MEALPFAISPTAVHLKELTVYTDGREGLRVFHHNRLAFAGGTFTPHACSQRAA